MKLDRIEMIAQRMVDKGGDMRTAEETAFLHELLDDFAGPVDFDSGDINVHQIVSGPSGRCPVCGKRQ